MPNHYAQIAFTPLVKKAQEERGSRTAYARFETDPDVSNRVISHGEAAFIAGRDSFYLATVGQTGWPYIQHRGGSKGFVRIIDDQTIGFADFRGNRQYISVGNLTTNDRVSLFFMDYANKTRLKMFGHARIVGSDDAATLARLEMPNYRARVERGIIIKVEAFDWNCPQHITERMTIDEVRTLTSPLQARIAELEGLVAQHATNAPSQ